MEALIGQVSPDQISAWKKEHKIEKVFTYKVEGRICYLKPVDREMYAIAASKVSVSPAKFSEEIINRVWLGGDDNIKNNNSYYFGLSDHVESLMNKKTGELGEL